MMRNMILLKSLAVCYLLSFGIQAKAQVLGIHTIKDEWYWKYGAKGLKIGDSIPDLPLGKVLNNNTGKNRIAQFKGKLLILDFWATSCTSCLENFPRMEELQQEFGDRIQILLVNVWETEAEIKKRLSEDPTRKGFTLPDLPIIVASKSFKTADELFATSSLFRLFPSRGVPHHVWIDDKGIVQLIGGDLNTYADKIQDLLDGKEVFSLSGFNTIPSFTDRKAMLYQQLGSLPKTRVAYGSFLTAYTNELNGYGGEIVDSSTHTFTRYFINRDLMALYGVASSGKSKGGYILYPVNAGFGLLTLPQGFDTLLITTLYAGIAKRRLTDKESIRSKYCYEQVVPLSFSKERRDAYMLEDLNRYFDEQLGIRGSMEKRKMMVYALIRTSKHDRIATSEIKANFFTNKDTVIKSISFRKYRYKDLDNVLQSFISGNAKLANLFKVKKEQGLTYFIVNETGWDLKKKVDMVLPVEGLRTVDDLRKALQPYDLDIIETERELSYLVFRKSKPI